MHDIKSIRDNPQAFDAGLARRGLKPLSASLLAIDETRRAAILASEQAQARRNAASKEIGDAKKAKDEARAAFEAAKAAARSCLKHVLSEIMVVAHPIIPFVTQEIWSCIPSLDAESLAVRPYPKARPECENETAVRDMEFLQGVIVAVRNIRAELGVAPGIALNVLVRAGGEDQAFLAAHETEIAALARVGSLTAAPDIEPPKGCASAVVRGCELFVPLAGVVDFEAELARLDKELGKIAKELDFVTKKLGNESFVSKAPEDVVAKEKAKAAEFAEKKAALEQLRAKVQEFVG